MNTELYQVVCSYINSHFNEMLSFWKKLVNMESHVKDADSVNHVADFLKAEFEKEGFHCHTVDVGAGSGHSLVGILGEERGGRPIVFSGHMDTVFPKGTFGENPFHIEGDKAYGPGVLDMKGGITIALYVCKALNQAQYHETPLKILFSGNEEGGHANSTGGEVFDTEGANGKFAFNMETGRVDGAFCIGRKGVLQSSMETCGREAHAGNDFTSGRNAIEEMAHKILKIQALTDLNAGTTVNVGVIQGGTMSNAVPGKCSIKIDVRFTKTSEVGRIKTALKKIEAEQYVSNVTTSLTFISLMPPFETSKAVKHFYEFVKSTAKEYGLPEPPSVFLGGGSDASYIEHAGTPVLCSCGAQGEWNHTRKEYALVDSLPARCKLICAVILNQKEFC